MKSLIILAALVGQTNALNTDLPFAMGVAIAYSDACRAAGYQVGDPAKAIEALRQSAPPEALETAMTTARIAATQLARVEAKNALLPTSIRQTASIDQARPICEELANSVYGQTMVRHKPQS